MDKRGISGWLVLLIVLGGAAGCSGRTRPAMDPPFPRQALIAELQEFQQALGIERTRNFQRFSGERQAVYRCYFTGKLELPASYEDLRLIESDTAGCAVDEETYDVFFYPIEAVATRESPVSPALAEAPLERVLVVVPHEDFHEQPETKQTSPDIAEAAATLVGFLAATDFARTKYGETSPIFEQLNREAELFRDKSGIVNAYYDRLAGVYAAVESGDLGREEALFRKEALFARLERACASPAAPPVSFNSCPAAMNNAGLAFDRTYTRYYPIWFDVYASLGRDTAARVAALKRLLATGLRSEAELRDRADALRP